MTNKKTGGVGVIVGRFQVHKLHSAHKDLIDSVLQKHERVAIFLGLSPLLVTTENPLEFEPRKQMILPKYPNVNIHYIKDEPLDSVWSRNLDREIGKIYPNSRVTLYGGRDSFIKHYEGVHPTEELEPEEFLSGTELRRGIGDGATKASPDFRAGVIYAAERKYPVAQPTVDVAIFKDNFSKLLLGKKPNEISWRFIGGYAEPNSPSYEADARREVAEEAGIEITDPVYLDSFIVDDWRYRKERDKIKTSLFVAEYAFGSPKAGDDIEAVRWFPMYPSALVNLEGETLVETHKPLMNRVEEFTKSLL